ncbi:MAG: Aminodeoxychorismate lyase [candidate division WWE3 bacterium GW2011_GWA1_41_8]|uniref:Endolytic murein transglycosylase n=2 Tax=Katanobacteria TaxID=422282 RepID=A0A0G0X7L8_UNCKA|nr:MAG: Aminodeoxychorismate lyase [candidate division WWE3 bacterium GW2011_GWB1_41_6]KKS20940.1 MAG: Aminodeoxychorismate lyase [candidate division WWE3 bacterium GW2011_GWA1_41_8]
MVEELDPTKYHVLTPKMKKLLIIAGAVLLLVVVPILSYFYYQAAINRPSQNPNEIRVSIPSGSGLSGIAGLLYERDLLNSEFLFKLYVMLNKLDKNIQAGVYVIPAGTSIVQLADILQYGTDDTSVTFIEGWRVEEYARLANEKLTELNYEDFVVMAKQYEGYLFPDTYFVNNEIKTKELIELLRSTFDRKTVDVLTPEVLSGLNMTKEEVVIFASIVEREVSKEEDRPIVAGVLIKRWRNGEILGADATTQYSLAAVKFGCDTEDNSICPSDDQARDINWWPNPVSFTNEDIAFANPYNTRAVAGLPPAPISNPSLSSISAVVDFKDTEYLYYLTDSEGTTYYATTLPEHELNVARYLR